MPFLINKIFGKRQKSTVFKQKFEEILPKRNQFVLNNCETRFQKAETCFQNAETRFQNAKTALSYIFFARTWMDSAQKKACMLSIVKIVTKLLN